MIAPVLGIDPGHDGGAVLLGEGRVALAVLAWRRLHRKSGDVYATMNLDGDEQAEPSLHGVAQRISAELAGARVSFRDERYAYDLSAPWYHLAVEGLFARPGLALHGICSLAEATGEVTGPLRQAAISEVRPKASEWRSAVLARGWGRTSEEAERAALRLCQARLPTLGLFLSSRLKDGLVQPLWPHVCEAAAIALHRRTELRVEAAQPALVESRKRRAR